MRILVTGGAGYIGSHTLVELLACRHDVVVIDNLCNGSVAAVGRVQEISGCNVKFYQADVRDKEKLIEILVNEKIDAVIHFAGLKAVGESVNKPLDYYDVNVGGTLSLCHAMNKVGVKKLIFSSSATVYGEDAEVPYLETMPRGNTSNPYGTSKAIAENILTDVQKANAGCSFALLRYFNPIGAHDSGMIGEDPQGVPNNLMPFIAQVAVGIREKLTIFGGDYPTKDGTCERDYLHVVDLAKGHVRALSALSAPGLHIYNLGTGTPVSVMSMVKSFEEHTGVHVPYEIGERRAGDLPAFWADASKAQRELGWFTEKTLSDMMVDTWRWQSKNPNGYS